MFLRTIIYRVEKLNVSTLYKNLSEANYIFSGLLYERLGSVEYLLMTISGTTFLAAIFMAIIPCVTPRREYELHQSDYDFWRVYCHNLDITPRIPRRDISAFTVSEKAVECQAEENLGYETDEKVKNKTLGASVSTTQLITPEEIA